MGRNMCRLYDEQLVRNIMVATGLSIVEYVKKNANLSTEEICSFIELNAGTIIEDTINDMNDIDDSSSDDEFGDSSSWPDAGNMG